MKLVDILKLGPGTYIWNFQDTTSIETISDAHRRVQATIARAPYKGSVSVECTSAVLVDPKTYLSWPVIIITIL